MLEESKLLKLSEIFEDAHAANTDGFVYIQMTRTKLQKLQGAIGDIPLITRCVQLTGTDRLEVGINTGTSRAYGNNICTIITSVADQAPYADFDRDNKTIQNMQPVNLALLKRNLVKASQFSAMKLFRPDVA